MSRIILSVINDLSGDQRIHRIASTLQEAGHEVLVVGRLLPGSLPLEGRPYATHRMRLFFLRGKVFYLEFNLRLFFFLLLKKADILLANDLDTLLANFLAARLKGARLVYDSHEYFTEVPELVHRPRTQKIWLWLEQRLFPKAEYAYTVNGSLAQIYKDLYHKPVGVIRNVPFRRPFPLEAARENILIYQGALNLGRGLELMIDAMAFLPEYQLWIVGRGDLDESLRAQAASRTWSDRVIFQGFVPLEELAIITRQARLGFSLEEDLGANYRYASPNKVYDYIQAGVPVLVSDLPEMRQVVESYGVGELLPLEARSPELLAQKVMNLLETPGQYEAYREKCKQAAAELCWEKEAGKLLEIFSACLS